MAREYYIPTSPEPGILEVEQQFHDTWYADSNVGTAGDGRMPEFAFDTLADAYAAAAAGDTIILAPGHAETISTVVAVAKAGITIKGDPSAVGTRLPALTVTGAIDGISLNAANCTVENLRFVTPATATVTSQINIAAANCRVSKCRFEQGANSRDAITVTVDGELPIIEDCEVFVAANGPDTWIEVEGVIDRPIIRNNHVICSDGTNAFDTGAIDFNTQAVTNPMVYGNYFDGADAASTVIAGAGALVGDLIGGNVYAGSATPADTVTGIQEVLDQLSGADGIPTFPNAAIPANNVSIAEVLRQVYAALEGTAAGQNGVATWPASAAPGNNVSIAEVLGWINDSVQGANGVVSFPNAAVPADGVNLAEVLRSVWAGLMGTAAGENGITVWPAAAAPGDTVSIAEAIRYIVETLVGTLVNTGGTATLGGILGDLANVSLATRTAIIATGTAQAGGAATITLAATDPATVNDTYKGCVLQILSGTGVGQTALITAFDQATDIATVAPAWATQPDVTSVYVIRPMGRTSVEAIATDAISATAIAVGAIAADAFAAGAIDAAAIATDAIDADALAADAVAEIADGVADEALSGHVTVGTVGASLAITTSGTAEAGAAGPPSTITLAVATASAVNDFYNGQTLHIIAGTGVGQSVLITDYVGATRVTTVAPVWATVPDATSVYVIRPVGSVSVQAIAEDTILGANNANNAYDSSTTTADRNGSILERLEGLMGTLAPPSGSYSPTLGFLVSRSAADILDGSQKALFAPSGLIKINALYIVTSVAALDAGPQNASFVSNPTVGTDMALCAVLALTSNEVGTVLSLTGDVTAAMTGGTAGGAMTMQRPIIVGAGTIDLLTAGDLGVGGALGAAYLWYEPLAAGVTVALA